MQINKKYFILLVIFLLSLNKVNAHPFYVSICQIDYNQESNSLEISIKTFTDDLLLGLENEGKTKIYLGEKTEDPKADEYIYEYLKSQFSFKVNEHETKLLFVGREIEKDVVWTYLEIENITALNTIEIECTLLTEVLESQSNIVQVNKNGVIKNLLFSKNKTADSLNYD